MNTNEIPKANRKIINITGKRQITIPLRFYEKLKFEKEIECILKDDCIIIRPLQTVDEDATREILQDLIAKGYSGYELLSKYDELRQNVNKISND